MNDNIRANWLPPVLGVIALAPLLFLGGPDFHAPRSWKLAWQLGHPLLFFLLLLALVAGTRARDWSLGRRVGLGLAVGLAVGGAIEWLQGLIGREPSLNDLRLDLLGALLGALCCVGAGSGAERRLGWGFAIVAGAVLLVLDLRPLAVAVIDEYRAWRSFPVLSDFSTPFETGRWHADGGLRVVPAPGGVGGNALRVELRPAAYAGFRLVHFPRDWRGYRELRLRMHAEAGQRLVCRIHDRAHDDHHADRFNRAFAIVPGWNELTIPLVEVARAPRGRAMAMGDVAELGCFRADLRDPVTLHLGVVELR